MNLSTIDCSVDGNEETKLSCSDADNFFSLSFSLVLISFDTRSQKNGTQLVESHVQKAVD